MNNLALVWGLIIGFCIVMYVVLDGTTLGIGLILPWLSDEDRDIAMSVVLPTWDGNQTWLILGTAALYGAFPLAFSLLLPHLYLPLLLMGLALLFRGIAFEFRLKDTEHRRKWDRLFFFGSLVATIIQGRVLGHFVEGFQFTTTTLLPPDVGWFESFSNFTAISLIIGYGLLGSTRLIVKSEGHLQRQMFYYAKWFAALIAIASIIASLWSPFINEHVYQRWFDMDHWIYLAPLPIINGCAFLALIMSLQARNDMVPYWASIVLFICPFIGFVISIYPYIIPYHIPYWEAAAPQNTLRFILIGAVVMLPILVFYTSYAYWIFRGKVKHIIGY